MKEEPNTVTADNGGREQGVGVGDTRRSTVLYSTVVAEWSSGVHGGHSWEWIALDWTRSEAARFQSHGDEKDFVQDGGLTEDDPTKVTRALTLTSTQRTSSAAETNFASLQISLPRKYKAKTSSPFHERYWIPPSRQTAPYKLYQQDAEVTQLE
ncbi:hypothetical protein AXG93_2752s2330 [Marchantia polymorpha subsp. ruderalis]|uniref:Uncharacterized protein n=1 Tax=Marchantia polymorpha subsp. ruderalis TaxID=1480154 RepID=A0A176VWG1_MARPO|nr:hypothetical protein AXG93_2752s2330 [Marchantia polymorpha subsp. ruderalis]